MGWFSKNKPGEKVRDLEKEFEELKIELEPYIGKFMSFGRHPIVILDPIIKGEDVEFRYVDGECLSGHCRVTTRKSFKWRFGDNFNEARYNWLKLENVIEKFKVEGYE